MNKISSAIFALMFNVVAPAFAQAPSPVPALPDTERRTSYSITASTCNCSVGFQLYGDSTDVGNWITVWVNGAQVPSTNWTITSPTGQIGTIARPITNAVLNFTTAQTGVVQIVGARRPRRTSQFMENRGVSARDMNQVLSDFEAQNRETWDRSARTLQARPGETLALLPPIANRASMGACFDASGNLTSCTSIPSSTISAGSGIALAGTGTTTISADIAAGNGVILTGTHPIVISAPSVAGYVRPQDFGAACDGASDDAVALQAMITASTGKTIYLPPGPDCVTQTTLVLTSNTNITGAGKSFSGIRGAGAATPVFSATNLSNISLSNFACKGSNSITSWSVSSVGCFRLILNASATVAASNITLQGIDFSGFNTSYWNYVSLQGATVPLSAFKFKGNSFATNVSNIPTDPVSGNNSNWGLAMFSGSLGSGQIANAEIDGNLLDANSLCFGLAVYSNSYKLRMTNNTVLNAGQTNSAHCGNDFGINAYSLLIYDFNGDGNPPTNFLASGNVMIAPLRTGLYVVGDGDPTHTAPIYNSSKSVISNNLCDGQTLDDGLLPRGCIGINLLTDISLTGNFANNGMAGFSVGAQTSGVISVINNACSSGVTASGGVLSSCFAGKAGVGTGSAKIILKANYFDLFNSTPNGGAAVNLQSSNTNRYASLELSSNTIRGGWMGLNAPSMYVSNSWISSGNTYAGVANNWMANIQGLTGNITLNQEIFDSSEGAAGNGLIATGSKINMNGVKFQNRTSGSVPMYRADGACGTIMGTQFNNVVQAAQVYAGSLGTSNPSSCTLNYLEQVQNLTPSPTGGYVVDDWAHISTSPSTTHLERRMNTN